MADILGVAYGLRIFTLQELAEGAGGSNPAQMSKLLQRWQRRGIVVQLRRNLYCMIDRATGLAACSKYEIGSHLSETSYIGYHSALEYHGLGHQPFNEVFVSSMSRFSSFCYDNVDYTYCRRTTDNVMGVVTPKGDPLVHVTDVERTLLDCFDRIDRAGGIEELLHCMEGVVLLDENRLTTYLAAMGKAFLYQKAGYLLERIGEQAHISDTLLGLCHAKGARSVKWLTNDEESDTFVNRWRLYVPQVLQEENAEHELI